MKQREFFLFATLLVLISLGSQLRATVTYQTHKLLNSNAPTPTDVQMAPNGNLYVGSYGEPIQSSYFQITSYPPSLSDTIFVSSHVVDATSGFSGFLRSMAITPNNYGVLVGDGWSSTVKGTTCTFDDDGVFKWIGYYGGTVREKQAMDVASDANSNLYVAIRSLPYSYMNQDSGFVIKYDSEDGDTLWLKTFQATSSNKRYSPTSVVAGPDGYIYVALEEYTKTSGSWYDSVRVYKFSANSSSPIDTSALIGLQDANNLIYDMVYVSCTYVGCGGAKLILLTEDGIISFNASDMTTSSSIQRQGYTKISPYVGNWFAVAGPYGVGRFDVSNVSTPEWECTSTTTYMDVVVTPVGGIVCVDTLNNDVRITHFPPNADACNDADTRVTHDGGASAIDYPVALAAAEGTQASNIYVAGKTDGKLSTMWFTVTSSITQCTNSGNYYAGDADGNGLITVSDPVYLIAYVFSGGPAPSPLKSGDADGSGMVSVSDAVYLINYIFSGGSAPVCGG